MIKYRIYGMMCAACAAHVENAARGVEGVTEAAVNLLGAVLTIQGDHDPALLMAAVHRAGYRAEPLTEGQTAPLPKEEPLRLWPPVLSLFLSLWLMLVSMGHMVLPLPAFVTPAAPLPYLFIQLALTIPVLLLNTRYFVGGTRSLLRGAPNMDSLIAMGAGAAVLEGGILLGLTLFGIPVPAEKAAFHSAGMILSLVSLGKVLEGRAKNKTAGAIRALSALTPDTVTVKTEEGEQIIAAASLSLSHILLLRPGDRIPCDGVILTGELTLNEASVTGESLPVQREEGGLVISGTLVESGTATVQPLKVGADTSLSATIRMVSEAAGSKAPIAKLSDRVSGVFVPVVMGIALLTLVLWLGITRDSLEAWMHTISVLVISCPCALGLATPTAIMVAMGKGAELGILLKNAAALEAVGRIKTVAFDKTGTLTEGQMAVMDQITAPGVSVARLHAVTYGLEQGSAHPIAKALCAHTAGAEPMPFTKHATQNGKGVFGKCNGESYAAGNAALMEECEAEIHCFADFRDKARALGAAVIYVTAEEEPLGAFMLSDRLRPEAKETIDTLHAMQVRTLMLTGDAEAPALAVGQALGIDEVYHTLPPAEKGERIRALKKEGTVAMVGDGINDALPLVSATVGIALGSGTDVAVESADAVLRGGKIRTVPTLIALGRLTLRKIKQNLFWALCYNTVCIPLAAGVLAPVGISLSPTIAALAMAASSLCVVSNALTIRRFTPKQ